MRPTPRGIATTNVTDTDAPPAADTAGGSDEDASGRGIIDRIKAPVRRVVERGRRRSLLFDRLVLTAKAYTEGGGDREAAGLSYYGFLSVFPILLLAVAVLGRVMRDAEDVRATVLEATSDVLPGASGFLSNWIDTIIENAEVIGVVALFGVVWSGLGAIDVLRGALDRIFGVEKLGGIKGKLRNLRFMALSGVLLAFSVAFGTAAAWGANAALLELGIEGAGGRLPGTLFALVLGFLLDVLLFIVLFAQLPDHTHGWRDILPGALFAAVGWTILKQLAGTLLAASAARASARYGIAAGVFGLLLAINLAAKLTLFAGQWAACAIAQRRRPIAQRGRPLAPPP